METGQVPLEDTFLKAPREITQDQEKEGKRRSKNHGGPWLVSRRGRIQDLSIQCV